MSIPREDADRQPAADIHDCWSRIGVRGDGSCPELKQHVHCRNCPVYSAAATRLLDAGVPGDYLARWTTHFAQVEAPREAQTESIVLFRVGREWFGISTSSVTEVANPLPVHSLPHRPNPAVLGLANVRGELLVCLSLSHMLGLEREGGLGSSLYTGRLLVLRRDQARAVCPVDEVHGIHRFHPREVRDVPATIAKAATTYSRSLLSWRGQSIGILDDDLLFRAVMRSVS